MGRPSKLTEKQWSAIGKRLLGGEKPASLAKEFKVDRAAITRKFSQQVKNVRNLAERVIQTENEFKSLPVAQQIEVITLADELRAISTHLAGAAKHGAMTSHRLSILANTQVQKLDDVNPINAESTEALKGVAVLTELANKSATIGLNLLAANKDQIAQINMGGAQSQGDIVKELAQHLPN